jgi:hypothetical protein
MSWNANNRAHACLWTFEIWHKKQRDAAFDEVGAWNTDFIIGFAAGGSAEMRSQNAETHAEMLDEAFTSLFRAGYEASSDRSAAITAMTGILNDAANTVAELADVVDEHYRFIGEV